MNIIGVPTAIDLEYHDSSLVCTSSGGPATHVIWRKNGQSLNIDGISYLQTQKITFIDNATYETTLHLLNDSIENYSGTYECTVINSRGSDSLKEAIEGEKLIVN